MTMSQQNSLNLTIPVPTNQGGTGQTAYTLGELLVGNGTSLAPLTPGTNGYVLTADSTQTLGMAWEVLQPAAAPNILMTGVFGTPYTVNDVSGSYNLSFQGDEGIATFARNNSIYILNTRQPMVNASIIASGAAATNGYSYQVKNTTTTPFAITLNYVTSYSGEAGVYNDEVQFISCASGTYSILNNTNPIQFGNQVVPLNGHLISNNPGDSITMKMGAQRDSWIVTQSVGTWTITTT